MSDTKKTFKIPVTWEVYGTVLIDADSLDEAIEIFDKIEEDISLPDDSYYVDGSFRREDAEMTAIINEE